MAGAHIGHALGALSQRRGESVVTVHGHRRRTGHELLRRIADLSGDVSCFGVKPGERVVLAGLNSDHFFEWLLAVPCAGGIVAPLNHRWSVSEAAEAINRIEACLLVLDEFCSPWKEELLDRCPSLRAAVRMEGSGVRTSEVSPPLVREQHAKPLADISQLCNRVRREGEERELLTAPGGVALVCFTSGTTGAPKAAILTHTALVTQSLAKIAALGYNDKDVYLHAAPLCHIGGISSAFGMLMAGATHVFLPRWRVDDAISAAQTHHVTTFIAVPAMLADIIKAVGVLDGLRSGSGVVSDRLGRVTDGSRTDLEADLDRNRTGFAEISDGSKKEVQQASATGLGVGLEKSGTGLGRASDGSAIGLRWGMGGFRTPFEGIRTLLVGGGAIGSMAADVVRIFPNAVIATAYGMTEAASSITFDIVREPFQTCSLPRWITAETNDQSDTKSSSRNNGKGWAVCVGRPAPHLEIRIVTGGNGSTAPLEKSTSSFDRAEVSGAVGSSNTLTQSVNQSQGVAMTSGLRRARSDLKPGRLEGREFAPPFREGVIQVRGPNVFLGYWNQGEETAKVLSSEGWFTTGDVGYVDGQGRLWLCGREKDMVKTGGENVHAAEVEAVLTQHPGVSAAAVVGLPDARLGEQVAALLVLEDGWNWEGPVNAGRRRLDAEEMRLHCHRQGLTRYKIPRVFASQTGPLPVTSTGKVQKNLVRDLLRKGHMGADRVGSNSLSTRSKL